MWYVAVRFPNPSPWRKPTPKSFVTNPRWTQTSLLTSKKSSRAASLATSPPGSNPRLQRAHRRGAPQGKCGRNPRSEEHTSELQSRLHLVCRLLLEKKKNKTNQMGEIMASAQSFIQHHNYRR